MSLVFVEGLGDVEFNDYEHLTFTDGWNGGKWSNLDVVKNPCKYNIIHVSDDQMTFLNCVSKIMNGFDYDMGHRYEWKSLRLYAILNTQIGDCEICLSDKKSIMYSLKK